MSRKPIPIGPIYSIVLRCDLYVIARRLPHDLAPSRRQTLMTEPDFCQSPCTPDWRKSNRCASIAAGPRCWMYRLASARDDKGRERRKLSRCPPGLRHRGEPTQNLAGACTRQTQCNSLFKTVGTRGCHRQTLIRPAEINQTWLSPHISPWSPKGQRGAGSPARTQKAYQRIWNRLLMQNPTWQTAFSCGPVR